MALLIVFESLEGQTKKIARHIAEKARLSGHEIKLVNTANRMAAVSFDGVDHVILAAPVHERRHPKSFEVFVGASRKNLQERQTLMLSVSLKAAFKDGVEDAQEFLTEMKMRTRFNPTREFLVAGAVRTGGYDYFASQILEHVILQGQEYALGDGDHEFTDWDALDSQVSSFLENG